MDPKPKHKVRTPSPYHQNHFALSRSCYFSKDPLDPKTQGNREKGFSYLPDLSTTAGPQTDAKAACLSPELYFPPK